MFDQNQNSNLIAKDLVRLELGSDLITFGDYKTEKGKEVPVETYLTPPLEYCSKQGLDYIFHLTDKTEVKSKIKPKLLKNSVKCEK